MKNQLKTDSFHRVITLDNDDYNSWDSTTTLIAWFGLYGVEWLNAEYQSVNSIIKLSLDENHDWFGVEFTCEGDDDGDTRYVEYRIRHDSRVHHSLI